MTPFFTTVLLGPDGDEYNSPLGATPEASEVDQPFFEAAIAWLKDQGQW